MKIIKALSLTLIMAGGFTLAQAQIKLPPPPPHPPLPKIHLKLPPHPPGPPGAPGAPVVRTTTTSSSKTTVRRHYYYKTVNAITARTKRKRAAHR
jgi:hypothetical protein